MKIEYDRYSLKIEGKREFIWSGAIHYYRLPVVRQWAERLKMMRDAGLNAADVYVPWNYHSEKHGKYDFSGNRDVEMFLDEVEKAGLFLIARPGPYICAEIDGGGLPAWLIAKKNIALRCRKEGRYVYDEEYMKHVREWWEQIVPKIAGRENLILFQVENEYNFNPVFFRPPARNIINFFRKYNPDTLMKLVNSDQVRFLMMKAGPKLAPSGPKTQISNEYIRNLYEWSREMGINVPIFHNDIMSMAGRVADVDLMAIDDYAVTEFSSDWREKKLTFAGLDLAEEGLDLHRKDNPVFMAEFQGSWFDNWGGCGYDRIRGRLGTDQLDLATKSALAQRATLINYFMFCGGTTWGYFTSPDVYTSYDKGAPIAESGQATRRYAAVKWLINEISKLGDDILETEPDDSVKCSPDKIFCRARRSAAGNRYIFLRNTGHGRTRCRLNCFSVPILLKRAEMKVIVLDGEGTLIGEIGPCPETPPRKPPVAIGLPELSNWTVSRAAPQIAEGYDASGWRLLEDEPGLDFDSLGWYYGYGWYRGTFRGRLKKIEIDARHCFSIYLNGKLVESKDSFRNRSGVGDDVAEAFEIRIPQSLQHGDLNVITVLVESLGHNKDFECDAQNPRGIVKLKCKGAKVVWRFRGGLLDGEKGLTPVLPKKSFSQYSPKTKVELPHFWEPHEEGIGLYETTVTLNVKDPEKSPVGIVIPEAHSKANIYINGYLMGRYWEEMGPQHKFFVPWGILNPKGKNHIAIAVWKRWETGCLGKVRLEQY